jgi:hypothetical protein
MAELSNQFDKWPKVWRLFDVDEQHDACLCYVKEIAEDSQEPTVRRFIKRIAEGTGSRTASVLELAKEEPDKLAHTLRTRAQALFDHGSWKALFGAYYFAKKSLLMCTFLDRLGIAHNEHGGIDGEYEVPTSESIATAVAHLLRTFQPREVGLYLAVLVLHEPRFASAADERDRILAEAGFGAESPGTSAASQGETVAESSPEFTVLDRVIIDHVVRSAMDIEGCLDPKSLEELVEKISRLNEKWHRAYFFLGLMDVLIPKRSISFDHPGDNDQRRWWYLAGVIAGLVRGHDLQRLSKAIDERSADFARAVQDPGGAGSAIAKIVFKPLIECERLSDAIGILRGQLSHVGLELGEEALSAATIFIRQSRYDLGKPIIEELRRHELEDEEPEDVRSFQLAVARRWGQCLQAEGNFAASEKEFKKLVDEDDPLNSPDLLADVGLVKGSFRSVTEIKLPESKEERIRLRDSLLKGEDYYKRAIDRFSSQAPKAAYALATLAYLRWLLSSGNDDEKERRREQAASLSATAITAIQSFEFGATYKEIGALGQCQFMLAVTKMSALDELGGQEALMAWKTITESAGRLPSSDIRLLLDAAEYHGEKIADEIAESVWDFRKEDAYEILSGGPWMIRSLRLRAALIELAKREQSPRAERVKTWRTLIPSLISANDLKGAEEGLAQMEELAEDTSSAEEVLQFFNESKNYDPALRESEAAWIRVELLRRLGRDAECVGELQRLFYLVRDTQPWEAEQIVEAFNDWNLDTQLKQELEARLPTSSQAVDTSVETRLTAGEYVRVLFVGGNEVQARYDSDVAQQIRREWPGVEIQFEHTGWSANWGRELPRLIGLANGADAVVLMVMMRTLLGRRLREALKKPWISCRATGKAGMLASVRRAALVGLEQRGKA